MNQLTALTKHRNEYFFSNFRKLQINTGSLRLVFLASQKCEHETLFLLIFDTVGSVKKLLKLLPTYQLYGKTVVFLITTRTQRPVSANVVIYRSYLLTL